MVNLQNLSGRKSVPPFHKQSFTDVIQGKCSKMIRNIHRKIPALGSLFNKVPIL